MRAKWIRCALFAVGVIALILLASCRYYVVEDPGVLQLR